MSNPVIDAFYLKAKSIVEAFGMRTDCGGSEAGSHFYMKLGPQYGLDLCWYVEANDERIAWCLTHDQENKDGSLKSFNFVEFETTLEQLGEVNSVAFDVYTNMIAKSLEMALLWLSKNPL